MQVAAWVVMHKMFGLTITGFMLILAACSGATTTPETGGADDPNKGAGETTAPAAGKSAAKDSPAPAPAAGTPPATPGMPAAPPSGTPGMTGGVPRHVRRK
jgi:hypothetical protein